MAELILYEKKALSKDDFIEIKMWKVPKSEDFPDGVKYSLVYVHNGKRILGYDNERAKGHHRHFEDKEEEIKFEGPEKLITNFIGEVERLFDKIQGGRKK